MPGDTPSVVRAGRPHGACVLGGACPADLLELHLPSGQLFSILLGFNLCVEIGQLTLVLATLGLVALLVRTRFALPRPIVVDTLSGALVCLGTYWFISRSYA